MLKDLFQTESLLKSDQNKLELEHKEFTLINENEFINNADVFRQKLFNECFCNLSKDIEEIHRSRLRARDVLWYKRLDNGTIEIRQAESTTVFNKGTYPGTRTDQRANLFAYQEMRDFATGILSLIPLKDRKTEGDIGFCLFRTFSVVTNTRHRDNFTYVGIYCLNKNGDGAITELSTDSEGKEIVWRKILQEGEILLFNDQTFYHYTTDIVPIDQNPYRDIILITLD